MDSVRKLFGPFPRGCGMTAAPRTNGLAGDDLVKLLDRVTQRLLVILLVATNLVLAVRGEDLATVIAYGVTVVITSAVLVRLISLRGLT